VKEVTPSIHEIKKELYAVNEQSWKAIANLAPSQGYAPGIELFRQETQPRDIYLIEDGLIKLVYAGRNDREVIVGLRSPGWIVGAAPVVLDKKHPFSATTLSYCKLRRITAEIFLNLLKTDQEFAWYFHRAQSHELYDQLTQLVGFGCLSARDKLEQLLSQLVSVLAPKNVESKVRLKLPLKHWEVAELIGVTPEHLSRVLKEMQKEGLVHREKGWINIADTRSLREPFDLSYDKFSNKSGPTQGRRS